MGNISSILVIVVVLSIHMVHSFHGPRVPVIIRCRGDRPCYPSWISHRSCSSSARTTSSCLLLDTGTGDDGGSELESAAGLVHFDTDTGRDSSISTNNNSQTVLLCEAVDQWLRVESLSSLVSQADMMSIIVELRQSEMTYQRIHPAFSRRFDAITGRMKAEKRSLRQILDSPKDEKKLLDFVETLDIGDPMIVKLLLQDQMPLFENMLGGILYEGIFEFLRKVDIIGNIINRLPIIGPIRVAIMKEFKASLDKTLGGQIKTFLSSFNKVAVTRLVEFINAPSNKKPFRKLNRNLMEVVLSRPLKEMFGDDRMDPSVFKEVLWEQLMMSPIEDVYRVVDYVYSKIGSLPAAEYSSVGIVEVLRSTPTLERVLAGNVQRFLTSSSGKDALQSMHSIVDGATVDR